MNWKRSAVLWTIATSLISACLPSPTQCDAGFMCKRGHTCSPTGNECISNCGNGRLDWDEPCDNSAPNSVGSCSPDCTTKKQCDNGEISMKELRNEHKEIADDSCVASPLPYCGDGDAGVNHGVDPDAGEVCDDGNDDDETACPYGVAPPCYTCDHTCSRFLGPFDSGTYCGDGALQAGEACDDGNAKACGLCSADCKQIQRLSLATGIIKVVSEIAIADGETLAFDGGTMGWVIEFDTGNGVDGGHTQIITDGGADSGSTIAGRIADVIGGVGLGLIASGSGGEVSVMAQHPGGTGNWLIQHYPSNSNFILSGMTGGAGRDCLDNTGCTSNDDCASRSCDGGVCRPDAG